MFDETIKIADKSFSLQEKQNDVHWMLQCILSSVERGATRGPLFEFTPEFYMDTAINAFHGLRHYFHPTTNFNDIPGKLLGLRLSVVVVVFIVVFTVSSLCFITVIIILIKTIIIINHYSAKARVISINSRPTRPKAELAKIRRYYASLSALMVL